MLATFTEPEHKPRYCVIGLIYADRADRPQLLSVDGKVVIWSTPADAQSFLPWLGGSHRKHVWLDAKEECIGWTPPDYFEGAFNRAVILTGYDPYNVPANNGSPDIRSEAHGLDWRYHILYTNVMEELRGLRIYQERQRNEWIRAALAGAAA